jgi:hypothetical protein
MSQYLLYCEHTADECEALGQEYETLGAPELIRGKDYWCSCPYGFHAGWVTVEAESEDAALKALPPINRSHTKAYRVESMRF